MITPEFLQSCTDEQINRGVAWLNAKQLQLSGKQYGVINSLCDRVFIKEPYAAVFSPCQKPEQAWHIIQSNRINLISPPEHRQHWKACATAGGGNWSLNDFTTTHTKPLRAAMEVYILMSTAK